MESYPKIYLYRRIVQSKIFIDRHFAEPINLDNIAEEALFSKFHFIRLFKKTFRKTPHQYLISVRIEKAKELLKDRVLVSEVCYRVGFDSVTSFCDLFKRTVGVAPSQYQTEQRTRLEDVSKNPSRYVPSCFASAHGWFGDSIAVGS